jgi:hypothetical protein
VWGLEISEEAVACAIENAELNGIENAASRGNVGQTIEELREERAAPTSWWSTRLVPGSRARPCDGRVLSGRHGSSTSRATRLPSLPTSRCCATNTATSSSAAAGGHVPAHAARESVSVLSLARPSENAPPDLRARAGPRSGEGSRDTRPGERGGRDAVPRPDEHDGCRQEGSHPDHVAGRAARSVAPPRGRARRR